MYNLLNSQACIVYNRSLWLFCGLKKSLFYFYKVIFTSESLSSMITQQLDLIHVFHNITSLDLFCHIVILETKNFHCVNGLKTNIYFLLLFFYIFSRTARRSGRYLLPLYMVIRIGWTIKVLKKLAS